MLISAWRIFKPRHARTAFTGEGARRFGGRWNSPGVAAVYTADSIALAALEMLVHLAAPDVLQHYLVCQVSFEDSLVRTLAPADLPKNWLEPSAGPALQRIGDAWAKEQRSVVLSVPSAVVPRARNYVLNPKHADFAKVTIGKPEPFAFDPRLAR